MRHIVVAASALLAIAAVRNAGAINIVLDYTLDARNENWFDTQTPNGLARRNAVDAAAEFLSAIIINDDWGSLSTLDESFTLSDIAASTIFSINGSLLVGTPESDGQGYTYASSSNDIDTTNRSSVAANEYIVYVGAFAFDSGATAHAKASWDSSDRRNAAGFAGTEFNTWGGKMYFDTTNNWYTGSNPGLDPTDDYGIQDSNKQPTVDITTDNWDWSTDTNTWKGFQLNTIDPLANGTTDLYATALHELIHALGATTSVIADYVGVNASGDFIGPNLMQVYGGPVPGDGGHFADNTQSIVWDSDGIVSEVVLDPNSLSGVRKYFTQLDAALLRDLGYDVLDESPTSQLDGDYNFDGTVDAADYVLWRKNDGTQEGYDTWRANFGQMAGSGSAGDSPSQAAVPEPALGALLLAAIMAGFVVCRPGRRR